MQPEFVTKKIVDEVLIEISREKKLPALPLIRFESYEEGLSAQIMHIGPFPEEDPNIQKIHKFIEDKGYKLKGKHHEIYLSDPRKASPEKL